MAGLAVLIDTDANEKLEAVFGAFLQRTANYKQLEGSSEYASGVRCIGAKLDAPPSLHRGITIDPGTGSWLIAAGTVIDTAYRSEDGSLDLLLRDYLTRGKAVLGRCDGLFAMVIYHGLDHSLSIVSDPFGHFSVFYGFYGSRAFAATSALAVAKTIQSRPSEVGVNCFLRTGKVFGDMTLWQDVKRMPAATVLEFVDGAMHQSVYWTPKVDRSVANQSFSDSADSSVQISQQTLRKNLAREGKVWTDLTGGYDTRLVAMLLEQAGIPFKANSVGTPTHPDVRIAQTIAREMGWEYQSFDLPSTWPTQCPEYLADALGRGDAHLNVLLLTQPMWSHRQKARQYTTLLTGLGGEMWRGPLWWPEKGNLGTSTVVHYDRQAWSLMHPIPDMVFRADPSDQVRQELVRQFKQVGDRYVDLPNMSKLDQIWLYRETSHTGAWTSAAAGVQRAIPAFFFKDIVTHAISINYRWRNRARMLRYMLERYRPALANVELEDGSPAMLMRATNFYRFIPRYVSLYGRIIGKLGQIVLGRSLLSRGTNTGYSQMDWRQGIVQFAQDEKLFQPIDMHSGSLFNPDQLLSFLSQAQSSEFQHDEFLGRMITVEMALRTVGTATL
jgi:hypothetical protein